MIPRLPPIVFRVYLAVILAFIFAPIVSLVLMSFHEGKVPSFPIARFSAKWYVQAWNNPDLREATVTSLSIGLIVALVSTLMGLISAHFLCRRRPRGQIVYVAMISLPCLIPLLLSGIALLMYYQHIHLSGTKWSIIAAHVCYCSPFSAAIIRSSYQSLNIELEQAAQNLGAGPIRITFQIVVPQLWAALGCAAAISFLISWDEFVLAWFVGGFTKTLPTVIYGILGSSYSPLLNAVGTLVMLASTLLLAVVLLFELSVIERTRN